MTQQEYAEFVKQETPNSTLGINCLKAFIIGGLICTIGEGLMQFYKSRVYGIKLFLNSHSLSTPENQRTLHFIL